MSGRYMKPFRACFDGHVYQLRLISNDICLSLYIYTYPDYIYTHVCIYIHIGASRLFPSLKGRQMSTGMVHIYMRLYMILCRLHKRLDGVAFAFIWVSYRRVNGFVLTVHWKFCVGPRYVLSYIGTNQKLSCISMYIYTCIFATSLRLLQLLLLLRLLLSIHIERCLSILVLGDPSNAQPCPIQRSAEQGSLPFLLDCWVKTHRERWQRLRGRRATADGCMADG